jgi:4-hydroxy-4-methyl-2-oxoglutarate aldolase
MAVVIENISRTDRDTVVELGKYGVATIHEAQGRKGLMAPYMRPVYPGVRVSGTAITVSVPPCDNWMIHVAIEICQKGDIMVVAPTRGVSALVIDAGVRDIADLKEMGFPVWSKCISAQGTVKETLGDVNIPVVCAGQTINPGDTIIADDDGVVVVRREEAGDVLKKSKQREEKEAGIRKQYAQGELGLDMNNMRPVLAEKGLVYPDRK